MSHLIGIYDDNIGFKELAWKKNAMMAQIVIAWSIKKATVPIVGTTKLENVKDMIDE